MSRSYQALEYGHLIEKVLILFDACLLNGFDGDPFSSTFSFGHVHGTVATSAQLLDELEFVFNVAVVRVDEPLFVQMERSVGLHKHKLLGMIII